MNEYELDDNLSFPTLQTDKSKDGEEEEKIVHQLKRKSDAEI